VTFAGVDDGVSEGGVNGDADGDADGADGTPSGMSELTVADMAEMMDLELSTSTLPRSFASPDDDDDDDGGAPDPNGSGKHTAAARVGDSGGGVGGGGSGGSGSSGGAGKSAEIKPVNVDFNLLKNLLSSFSAQEGLAGAGDFIHSLNPFSQALLA
jgi:hypothetical protein